MFAAFMTGNIAFLGFRLGGAAQPSIIRVLAALAGFAIGAWLGSAMTRGSALRGVWPRCVSRVLAASVAVQVAFVILWIAVDGDPASGTANVLIAIMAVAMGMQTVAAFALGVRASFTTAATATLVALMSDLSNWALSMRLAGLRLGACCSRRPGARDRHPRRHWPTRRPLLGAVGGHRSRDRRRRAVQLGDAGPDRQVGDRARLVPVHRDRQRRVGRSSPCAASPRGLPLRRSLSPQRRHRRGDPERHVLPARSAPEAARSRGRLADRRTAAHTGVGGPVWAVAEHRLRRITRRRVRGCWLSPARALTAPSAGLKRSRNNDAQAWNAPPLSNRGRRANRRRLSIAEGVVRRAGDSTIVFVGEASRSDGPARNEKRATCREWQYRLRRTNSMRGRRGSPS